MDHLTDNGTWLARVAKAERDVQLAAAALQGGFVSQPGFRLSSSQLAQFSAALQELPRRVV